MALESQGSAPGPANRALLVAAEQVRIQYRSMPTAFISNAFVSVILCFTLRNSVPIGPLAGWLAAEILWVLARFLQWRAFRRAQPAAVDISRWGLHACLGSSNFPFTFLSSPGSGTPQPPPPGVIMMIRSPAFMDAVFLPPRLIRRSSY